MAYKFFDKKTRSGVNVNEELAEEIHKPVIKNSRRVYQDLKIRFGQQTELRWNHCLLRIEMLNIYYV